MAFRISAPAVPGITRRQGLEASLPKTSCPSKSGPEHSSAETDAALKKARFWSRLTMESLNARQIRVLNRLLDGFEGKLTSSKWAKLTNVSQDTAPRDIRDLIDAGVLVKDPSGGRSTSYSIVELNGR